MKLSVILANLKRRSVFYSRIFFPFLGVGAIGKLGCELIIFVGHIALDQHKRNRDGARDMNTLSNFTILVEYV